MDRFAERQGYIQGGRDALIARYPSVWQAIITNWKSPGPDQTWLMYAANYLFRTGNVRWALDPVTVSWRLKEASARVDVSALRDASFILLTHSHEDHLDLDLLSALRHFPIKWVVPEPMLTQVTQQSGITRDNMIVPKALQAIELNGIRITPFDGLHLATEPDGTVRGVPATGYMAEFSGKRWLFPGDTRIYDTAQLPDFGPLDGLFAHLWLGRGSALMEPPPLLEAFCNFCLDLHPDRIVITHMQEFNRNAADFWDETHLPAILSKIQAMSPRTSVQPIFTGESILL